MIFTKPDSPIFIIEKLEFYCKEDFLLARKSISLRSCLCSDGFCRNQWDRAPDFPVPFPCCLDTERIPSSFIFRRGIEAPFCTAGFPTCLIRNQLPWKRKNRSSIQWLRTSKATTRKTTKIIISLGGTYQGVSNWPNKATKIIFTLGVMYQGAIPENYHTIPPPPHSKNQS